MIMIGYLSPAGRAFDPIRQMRQAQQVVNRLLGNLRLPTASSIPLLNIWIGHEGALITAEVPGVPDDGLEIAVHQNTVTLRGNRPSEPLPEGAVVHRRERMTGPFTRSVLLPFRVDGDRAAARFRNGVLSLEVPRAEADRPHRISVSRE
jgi:HSP20 family protein